MLARKLSTMMQAEPELPFPEEAPTSYSTIGTYSSATTWEAPESGYFTIELFGASGRGGYASVNNSQLYTFGESYDSEGNVQYDNIPRRGSTYGTGGGGRSGGYSKSIVKLMKGDVLELSPGGVGATSTVKINSSVADTSYSTMTVTAGASGGNGAAGSVQGSSSGGTAGTTGGVGSGGNSANHTGYNGGAGYSSSSYYGSYNGGAGGSAVVSGARPGGAGAGVTTGTSYANDYYNGSYINNQHTIYNAGSPGAGQAGYVKISRGNTNVVSA